MSLEFLAPDRAEPFEGGRPLQRSPIEWVHRDAGARFEQAAGWNVVAGYGASSRARAACRETVGIADASQVGKIELQGERAAVDSIVAGLAGGTRLEPGSAALRDGVWWCPVTADRVLALSEPEATADLRGRLESASASAATFVSVTELTAALGSNAVVGPLAREAFARTTALDMRPDRFEENAFAPVSVARTPAMVLRQGRERYLHLFGAGYASYVWTVFIDAVESLGGAAVGAEGLRAAGGGEVGTGA